MAKQSRKAFPRLFLLLVLVLLAAWGGAQWVGSRLVPVRPGAAEPVVLIIPGGASVPAMATILQKHGLIKDPTVFRYYARYRGVDSQLKPGEYQFTAGMNLEEILAKLASGETIVHRFVIPEGKSLVEVADLLAAQRVVDREEFLKLAHESPLAAAYLPKDEPLPEPLEGYLFPATYEYKIGVSETEILNMMFARFEKVWTPELLARAKELELSVHQVITLASIVEEEAQVAQERPRIAGVYANRLKIGMKLDADPTVAYAAHKAPGEALTAEDLASASPYNTYRRAGLPPGPIAAPGEASIRAALYPEQHDYWYFVAKADGSGQHYFAATLEEQDQNIGLAEANAEAKQ